METTGQDTAGQFLDRAGPWLGKRRAENNLIVGLAATLIADPSRYGDKPFLLTIESGDEVVGAALMTPPFKLLVTRMAPEALRELARYLHDCGAPVPAVLGPDGISEEFARYWTGLHGGSFRKGRSQGVYAIERVIPPARPADGSFRRAREDELETLIEWAEGFTRDIRSDDPVSDSEKLARGFLAERRIFVWEDGGKAVSVAGFGRETADGASVTFVYTPPENRNRGYASSCVAALTQFLFDAGKEICFLYTDLSNPVSNSVYMNIGYKKICDAHDYRFDE